MDLRASGTASEKFCNLYPHLCLETVFPTLNLCKIIISIIIQTFWLKSWWFNHKLAPPLLCHMSCWRTILTVWQKYEGQMTSKIPAFKHFSELGKICWCSPGFSKIPIHHFYELGKTWSIHSPTHISKSKFWIYGWIGRKYVLI